MLIDPSGHQGTSAYSLLQKVQQYGDVYNSYRNDFKNGKITKTEFGRLSAEVHCKADFIRSAVYQTIEYQASTIDGCAFDDGGNFKALVDKYFTHPNGQSRLQMDNLLDTAYSFFSLSNGKYDIMDQYLIETTNIFRGVDYNETVRTAEEVICFTGDTLIYTKYEYKPIRDISIGDEVYSENVATGKKGLKKVKNVFIHETNTIIHIFVGNEDIITTPNHPFWVVNKGWVAASEIKKGDKLNLFSSETQVVKLIKQEKLCKPIKVYNFEVEDWHTYFVTRTNIIVHNTCSLFVPQNNKWTPAGNDMWTWATQNGYRFNIGRGTDIGKMIVSDARGILKGEIHLNQPLFRGSDKICQPHFQKYINGAVDHNNHLYFED